MRSAYWKTNVFFFLPQSYIFQRHARELQLFSLVYELLYATVFAFHLDMQEIFFPLYTYFSLALVVMSLLFFIILKLFILFCELWNISLQALKQVILSPVSFSKRGVFLNIFLKSYFLSFFL